MQACSRSPLRWVRFGLLLAALLVGIVAFLPQGRTAIKTALFVPQILPVARIHPQEWFVPDPVREAVHFPTGQSEGEADLYLPKGRGRHAAVLLFLGVNPAGRDDPRVVRLAQGLARAGMVVMVPWSQAMAEKRIETEDVDNLVHAFQYLERLDQVDSQRVGIGGFCVGASFAAVAAADPRINERVTFLNFFGGYYSMRDLAVAVSSRTSFYGDGLERWEPDSLTREVFAIHMVQGLDAPADRDTLTKVFLEGGEASSQEINSLSPPGKVVYRLLQGVSVEEARTLVTQLPPSVLESMDRLSPSSVVDELGARVLVMADRQDKLVPSTESRRLADVLRQRGDVYYTEFSLFQHVDPTRRVPLPTFTREVWKLYLHLYNVLRVTS